MRKPKGRSERMKRQVRDAPGEAGGGLWSLGRSFIVAQMPLIRRRRSIKGTAGRRMGYSGGCADGDCHRVDATKPAQLQRQNGTFPRSLPGERPLEPGEVTASENWKVRRAHAGARRSLAVAPAPLRAGATGASGARAPPAPPRTAWPPPYRPGLPGSAPPTPANPNQSDGGPRPPAPEAPPRAGASPANGRPSPAPSARCPRRAGSEREKRTQPVGAAAPDPPPAAARRPPPAASSPPDRVYCPNPKVQFCGPAAASERASAMTQEYDK